MTLGLWLTRLLDSLIAGLAITALGLLMTTSPMALDMLGWNYEGLGGAGLTRFHPASYLVVLAFVLLALRDGNPLLSLIRTFGQDMRITIFTMIWLIIFAHGVVNQQLPAAGLIDTFLIPLLMFLIFCRLRAQTHGRMEVLMHAAFAANALLGLGEFLTGLRLTPYVAGGILITDDWRSTALFGHPLGNALLTGCYIIALLLGGGQRLTGRLRPWMIGLQFAAMVAFGGRASLVLLIAFSGGMLMLGFFRFLAGARLPLRLVALASLIIPILICVLGILFELGFFDKLIFRFVEDKGSANARVVMFELFNGFTWTEILLGPQQENLAYFVRVHKLEFGIESTWVAFTLYYGLLPAIFFFSGLFLFLMAIVSRCQSRAWIILIYFFLINTTFLGIAGKSIHFTTMLVLLMLMLPARHPASHTAAPGHFQPRPMREAPAY